MMISYAGYRNYAVKPGEVLVLGTNNQRIYADLIYGLSRGHERVSLADDQYNELTANKAVDWVGDVMNYDYRKPIEAMVKKIALSLNDQQINALHKIMDQLFTQIQDCLFMTNAPLRVTNDGDFTKLFKYCNIQFDDFVTRDFHGIINGIIDINLEIDDHRLIGLTNVAHYLTFEQFHELLSTCQSNNISLVLVEFTDLKSKDFYEGSNFYYIDEDFVDWRTD